jgi:DNA-binding PadR family transcriptional regulator
MSADKKVKPEKVPKTAIILGHISEHGPKTEYDLYRELPGISHGTIHYVLKNLTERGGLTIIPSKKREKHPKKLYNLNFIGVVTNLASYFPRPEMGVAEGKEAEYWDSFGDEIRDEIVEFLEKQGRLQEYVPFQDIRWLSEHFPGAVRGLVVVATLVCDGLPSLHEKPLSYLLFRVARKEDVEKERAEEDKYLHYLVDEAFRRKFTDLFFQLMFFLKSKGRTNNYRLRQFAEEYLEDRIHETVEIKHGVELFSRRKLSSDKMFKSKRPPSSSVKQIMLEKQSQSGSSSPA